MHHKIKKAVHHLRKQPEDTKRHIIHTMMFVFGALLFVLWANSLGRGVGDPATQASLRQDIQPFVELKEDLVGNASSSGFIELKSQTE